MKEEERGEEGKKEGRGMEGKGGEMRGEKRMEGRGRGRE